LILRGRLSMWMAGHP